MENVKDVDENKKTFWCTKYYFFPDFLIPPLVNGPFPAAFALACSSSLACSWEGNQN